MGLAFEKGAGLGGVDAGWGLDGTRARWIIF